MFSLTDTSLPYGPPISERTGGTTVSRFLAPSRSRPSYCIEGEIAEIKRTVHGVYRNVILYN